MEDKNVSVPYIVYEGAQVRQERLTKRLIVVVIILICMLFASNAMWLYVWNMYDYVDESVELDINADEGGNANYIGRDLNGELNNGENYGESEAQDPNKE